VCRAVPVATQKIIDVVLAEVAKARTAFEAQSKQMKADKLIADQTVQNGVDDDLDAQDDVDADQNAEKQQLNTDHRRLARETSPVFRVDIPTGVATNSGVQVGIIVVVSIVFVLIVAAAFIVRRQLKKN
jgi:hypothetical protein